MPPGTRSAIPTTAMGWLKDIWGPVMGVGQRVFDEAPSAPGQLPEHASSELPCAIREKV